MRPTEYTMRLTVCTPIDSIDDANQLALIVGETEADVRTFSKATHTRDGIEYACISTVAKPVLSTYTEGLPTPEHAKNADYEAAARALGRVVWDLRERNFSSPQNVIQELGFEPIRHDEIDDEPLEHEEEE